jgi:hypothetical protein
MAQPMAMGMMQAMPMGMMQPMPMGGQPRQDNASQEPIVTGFMAVDPSVQACFGPTSKHLASGFVENRETLSF